MNFPQKIASLALLSSLGLATIATPASALTFTKLVEVGQKVPGNDLPVTAIVEPTIGLDGQVAMLLETQAVPITNGKKTFRGVYTIAKGGSLKFVEGGNTTITSQGTSFLGNVNEVTAPSISGGKIAYLRNTFAFNQANETITGQPTALRVGLPGNVKTILTLPPNIIARSLDAYQRPSVAYVNGKVYFLTQPNSYDPASPTISLNVVDTQVASPRLQTLNQDLYNTSIIASANTLLLTRSKFSSLSFFESTGDANFKPITDLTPCADVESRSISTSHESIAATCDDPAVKVRFGRQGAFLTVPNPDGVVPGSRGYSENPSLSDRSVLYVRQPTLRLGAERRQLLLSKNGQKPITLLRGGSGLGGGGDLLDGKLVSVITLGRNGRALAGNFAVLTVQFTDNSQALYRIDL